MRDCVDILGVKVDRVTKDQMLSRVLDMAQSPTLHRVYYVNAHCLNLAQGDHEYRRLLNSGDLVYCDGAGVRFASQLLGQPLPERMTGPDWIHDLCLVARKERLSISLVGGERGVADKAAARLAHWHSGLKIASTHHGYFQPDSREESALLRKLRDRRPHIVLIGMGPPRQENWLDRVAPQLASPVGWTVGGLFDILAGRVLRAPRWMSQNGLEWLYRLLARPHRMAGRYLLGNPAFMARVAAQMIRTAIK